MPRNFLKLTGLFVGSWPLVWGGGAQAANLQAQFNFERRPPHLAVLVLEGDQGRPAKAEINQKNKQFIPELVLVPPGGELTIRNSDEVNHNVYADDAKQGVHFDIGLKEPGHADRVKANWPEGALFKLSCKIHSQMRGWVAVASSKRAEVIPFASSTRAKTHLVKEVPPELHSLRILLPGVEPLQVQVKRDLNQELPLMKLGQQIGVVRLQWEQEGK